MSPWLLYGSSLSPFSLKTRLLCSWAGLPFTWLPDEPSLARRARAQGLQLALRRGWLRPTHPPAPGRGELPLVPYLFGPGERLWDSSAIGHWLDARFPRAELVPRSPEVAFACRVIDEAVDELGLYLLHHQRWVPSAHTTIAPQRLAEEVAALMGRRLAQPFVGAFAKRQVRRLPYLFSVAPMGESDPSLPPGRRPPARAGLPPTHRLLERVWSLWLERLEPIFAERPGLFGDSLTLADASLFGMLRSILALDPTSAADLRARAPHLAAAALREPQAGGELRLHDDLLPFLETLGQTFVPLMQANAAAYGRSAGGPMDEEGFDLRANLFDGEMLGFPYRTVVKRFQVPVWRQIERDAGALPRDHRARVALGV